ncbi:MAG: hypothetical protein AAB776_03125 [Patescibacteria group bacterium]
MTPDQPQTSSKPHGLVIGLMFAVLLLSLVAVAVLVTTEGKISTTDEYVAACKSQVEGAVLDATREIARVCTDGGEIAPAVGTVTTDQGRIGFDYPIGWSVELRSYGIEPASWSAAMVPGVFMFCEGCDGPFIDVSMQVGSKSHPVISARANFNAYLLSVYTTDKGYKNINITQMAENGGTRYVVTGQIEGLWAGPIEDIYYEGETDWAGAFFMDADPGDTVGNDGWEIIKESLDFSSIR